jgi:hypothetical protein
MLRDESEMTDTLARNNQYPAGRIIAELLQAGNDAAPLTRLDI